ncbi:MAG: TolC family protein, partial [Pseudomonadota bacterium]
MKLIAGAFGIMLAAHAQAQTLPSALVTAYNHSGLLDQNRAVLRAADEDVAAATASLRPTIDFISNYAHTHSSATVGDWEFSARFDVSWLIYDGGGRALRREALKEVVLATRASLIGVEQGVLLDAVNAYMGVITQGETVSLRQNNLRLLTEELRAAQDRFDVGEVTRTDVALAEARLASARANLAAAEASFASAVAQYQNDVGVAPGALSTPTRTPGIPSSLDAAMALARLNHPDIIAG